MLMKKTAIVIVILMVVLAGCSKKASTGGQTATLALTDGTTVTGTVTQSDTSSITIQTPAGVVSTYPLSQVSSVNYAPNPAPVGAASNPPPSEPAAQQTQPPPAPAQPSPAPPPPAAAAANNEPPPPAQQEYVPAETFHTIPAGTTLAVRLDQSIDSRTAAVGQTYPGTIARAVVETTGAVSIPRGSQATLVIREARAQGEVEGRSELVVDVAAVRVNGHEYRLETSNFVRKGREGVGANQRTAKFAGGGALFGTIVGALAGGGKGAAIGALSGAAAGTAAQSATRGKNVRIPAETVLHFHLEAPIRIREMR